MLLGSIAGTKLCWQ